MLHVLGNLSELIEVTRNENRLSGKLTHPYGWLVAILPPTSNDELNKIVIGGRLNGLCANYYNFYIGNYIRSHQSRLMPGC
ncbi:hypothetical protein ABEB36_002639 [Hypothenemus hampei]|uniref:Uncharacterized protein n=1 Tax=Hypothenemus hampei TaxID=57062 RepID=A0ABD1F6I3_HYPHA